MVLSRAADGGTDVSDKPTFVVRERQRVSLRHQSLQSDSQHTAGRERETPGAGLNLIMLLIMLLLAPLNFSNLS